MRPRNYRVETMYTRRASAVTVRKLSKEAHLWRQLAAADKSLCRLTTGREEMKVHEIVPTLFNLLLKLH